MYRNLQNWNVLKQLSRLNGKMFNEAVLEEFVKANPGSDVPLMDQQHLEKPIQMKIVNGKVSNWIEILKMANIY